MKICIPVESNNGLASNVYGHFGSAPFFLIYDTENESFNVIDNTNEHHVHGMCHPLQVLAGDTIDVVICRGMGARAVQKLNEGNLKAYRTDAETVERIIQKYGDGALEEITPSNACSNHSCE